MPQDAAIPERSQRPEQEDEVPDEIHVDESHAAPIRKREGPKPSRFVFRVPSSVFRLPCSVFRVPSSRLPVFPSSRLYRVSLTTSAARRFRRRVSSRALSYFGRSSP